MNPSRPFFTTPVFNLTKWSFPSAPDNPVTCNYGAVIPSWFDIHEIPVTADSPNDESSVLKAVQNVQTMIDKEVAAGTDPNNVFVCGFSQGGAMSLASVLLYPRTLGGGAIFSGWVPFNSSMTPILWFHGMADRTVLFEAGQAGPPFLEKAGVSCEFKAYPGLDHSISNEELQYLIFPYSHGMADRTVLFEAGQAGPPFLEKAGVRCEFKELQYLESWIKARLKSSS